MTMAKPKIASPSATVIRPRAARPAAYRGAAATINPPIIGQQALAAAHGVRSEDFLKKAGTKRAARTNESKTAEVVPQT